MPALHPPYLTALPLRRAIGVSPAIQEKSDLPGRRRSIEDLDRARALRGGGAQARAELQRLYNALQTKMRRYFCASGVSPEEAWDLFQDVFVKAMQSLDEYRGDAPLEGWLWGIAHNRLMDHFRRRRDAVSLSDEDGEADPLIDSLAAPAAAPDGLRECLRRAFERFSSQEPERASLVILRALGWTHDEIAPLRKSTVGATREHLNQCMKRFMPFAEVCAIYLEGREGKTDA